MSRRKPCLEIKEMLCYSYNSNKNISKKEVDLCAIGWLVARCVESAVQNDEGGFNVVYQ